MYRIQMEVLSSQNLSKRVLLHIHYIIVRDSTINKILTRDPSIRTMAHPYDDPQCLFGFNYI